MGTSQDGFVVLELEANTELRYSALSQADSEMTYFEEEDWLESSVLRLATMFVGLPLESEMDTHLLRVLKSDLMLPSAV